MPSSSVKLIPFCQGGKWGFCNADREVVIGCDYDWVGQFQTASSHPLALVRMGRMPTDWRYGFIDLSGAIRIPWEYSYLESFSSCGLTKMRRSGKTLYGFIDTLGRQVTEHEFTTAHSFSEGRAYVKLPLRKRVEEHGFVDVEGKMRISGHLLFDDARSFQQGLAVVTHYAARGCLYSYLRPDGSFLTIGSPRRPFSPLLSASCFCENRALVYGELTGFAVIDTSGNVVADLAFEFDEAYPSKDGLFRVVKGGETGYLDLQGKEVVPCILDYAEVRDFSCGLAGFREIENGLWGFIDRTLEIVVPPKYNEVSDFCEGLAVVRWGESYGVVNALGQEVIQPRFSFIGSFENGLALARRDGEKFYINSEGVEFRS